MNKYSILKAFHEGHVFLRETSTGRIAVGDQSGYLYDDARYNIEACDDGVLWLDVTRPVTLIKRKGRYDSRRGAYFVSIPLLRPSGEATNTIGTESEARFCHRTAKMPVEAQGDDFRAEIIAITR